LVNFGKTFFSESFPDLWLFLMAALFIAVVLVFPNGLAGLVDDWRKRKQAKKQGQRSAPMLADAQDNSSKNLLPTSQSNTDSIPGTKPQAI
jgi:urea transport system permease protein